MKTLLIISYLLPLLAFGQNQKTLTLELSADDCRKSEFVRVRYKDTIQFFQNDRLFSQIITKDYNKWPIDIPNFKAGAYAIYYRNLYGVRVSRVFTIPDTIEKYNL